MNEHVDELLALYALGGLEAEELTAVDAHLAVCSQCQAEADRQTALVAAVAASVPARAPNPRLRAEVLSRVVATPPAGPARGGAPRAEPAQALPPPSPFTPADRRRLRLGWAGWLGTGLAVLMAGLIGWNVYLTSQVVSLQRKVQYNQNALALIAGADTAHVALRGQGAFATAGGNAYIDQQTLDIVLVVQRLQPLPPDQTYQAWIISDQGPTSAGLFRVSDNGWGMDWLNMPYVQGSTIGVSVEPKGGSPQPTHVVLLSAQ